jgi:hypothetical protein
MAEKKKVIAKRKVDRKAFVASRGSEKDKESRKRFYVKTRVAELEKAGKPVSAEKRKQLRQKFNSGDVSRKGFAAPKKKTGGSSSSSSPVGRTDSAGRSGMGATAPRAMPSRNQIEGRGGPSVSVRRSGANAAAGSRASAPSRDTSRNRIEGRGAYGSKSSGRSVGGHPRGAASRTIKKVLGGLGSLDSNRANPSRVSQSAAANRAAKAAAKAKKNK